MVNESLNTYRRQSFLRTKIKLDIVLLYVLFYCVFLLSDVYFPGIGRPFDYFSIFILLLIFSAQSRTNIDNGMFFRVVSLFVFVTPWTLAGIIHTNWLASVAFFIGVVIVYPLSLNIARLFGNTRVEMAVYSVIRVSLALFIIQNLCYYFFNVYLDFSSYLGSLESRGYGVKLNYFRGHGIFQEPNGYCTIMFCALSLCALFKNRSKKLEMLASLSLAASLSLWGIAATFVILLLLFKDNFKFSLIVAAIAILIVYSLLEYLNLYSLLENTITFKRLMNVADDPSFNQRSGGMSLLSIQLNPNVLLGNGVNTSNFQSTYGANGVSFLIYSFGVLGTLLLFLHFVFSVRFSLVSILSIAFLLTTYPPFSYMYFWLWIALHSSFNSISSVSNVSLKPVQA